MNIKKEVYRKLIPEEDDEPLNNQYVLEGEGKAAYDFESKVFITFTEPGSTEMFDVVFLKHGYRRFVEFKSVFEKEYQRCSV